MSLAKLQTGGYGTLRLRLAIEGWPIQWVTDASITAADNLDGRTVLPGLLFQGLMVDDRVVMMDAKADGKANSFSIVPPYGGTGGAADPLFQSLSLVPEAVAELETDLEEEDTTIAVTLGAALADNTVHHLGTETIRVGTFPATTRHIWDTQPQRHNLLNFDRSNSTRIYLQPATMEGRRAILSAYGTEDDPDGDGQPVWRGMVARAPTLDADGVTWHIETHPITQVTRQTVAGGAGEAPVVGIYHHRYSSVFFQIQEDDDWHPMVFYSGFDRTEAELFEHINEFLAAALVTAGAGAIDSLVLAWPPDTEDDGLRLVLNTTTGVSSFAIRFGSPLLGGAESGVQGNFWERGPNTAPNPFTGHTGSQPGTGNLEHWLTPGEWYLYLDVGWSFRKPSGIGYEAKAYEGSHGCTALGNAAAASWTSPEYIINPDPTAQLAWPEWRIFVEHSLDSARAVYVTGLRSEEDTATAIVTPVTQLFSVDATDSELINGAIAHYIDIVPPAWADGFVGIIYPSNEPTVTVMRQYSQSGTVADFVQEVKNESVYANDGDTPWITDQDLATWDVGASAPLRVYQFMKELALEDILAAELKLIGYFMRIEADGRIGVARLPLPAETYPCDDAHTITTASITTPSQQIIPGYAPQRDGVLTTVTIYDDYNAFDEEWQTQNPPFINQDAIATHKRRGQTQMEIKPYSRPAAPGAINFEDIAKRYLTFFGRDYVVITVRVPWKHFAVLCGDVVSLTHSKLPAGDGTRGLIARKCVCVSRSWSLSPGESDRMGTLELWMPSTPIAGYAPGGFITGQSDGGGNVWTLTLDIANALNIAVSTNNNGRVLEHFFLGDFIRIVQRDTDTPTERTGTVTASPDVGAGTIQVTLNSSWTPGASSWRLEFQRDVGGVLSTVVQQKFAYVAGSDGLLPTGSRGRGLS